MMVSYLKNVTTLEYRPDNCRGCGRCVEVCPHGVFALERKKAIIVDRNRCMECGACALNCDSRAIAVERGVGCASALINAMITGGEPVCGCETGGGGGGSCC